MASFIATNSPYLAKLRFSELEGNEKDLVTALIRSSSDFIQKLLNRTLDVTAHVEYHDGDGGERILLRNVPVVSLTSVSFVESSTTTVDGANFRYEPNTGELRWEIYANITDTTNYIGYFPRGFRNIYVTYSAGYGNIPEPIQYITAQSVIQAFDRFEAEGQLDRVRIGNESYAFAENAMRDFVLRNSNIISMYRRRTV